MALPLIIGAIALATGTKGILKGISGVQKLSKAKEAIEVFESTLLEFQSIMEEHEKLAQKSMNSLGEAELTVLSTFQVFCDSMERLQERPLFKDEVIIDSNLDNITIDKLKKISTKADYIQTTLASATIVTAGALAASGATTSIITSFGTASSGTAISSLTGAAASNAVLATIGGGSLATGGGGVALGSTLLGSGSIGIGLMLGGYYLNYTGDKALKNAKQAYLETRKIAELLRKATVILINIKELAEGYTGLLGIIFNKYLSDLEWFIDIVEYKTFWNEYTNEEKARIERLVLLVSILYKMCSIQFLVEQDEVNVLNEDDIAKMIIYSQEHYNSLFPDQRLEV